MDEIINIAHDFELICSCKFGTNALITLPVFNPDVVLNGYNSW